LVVRRRRRCYFRGGLDTLLGLSRLFRKRLLLAGTIVLPARRKVPMQRLSSLLRATPSRIGRCLALIVAIAVASLPAAGA